MFIFLADWWWIPRRDPGSSSVYIYLAMLFNMFIETCHILREFAIFICMKIHINLQFEIFNENAIITINYLILGNSLGSVRIQIHQLL